MLRQAQHERALGLSMNGQLSAKLTASCPPPETVLQLSKAANIVIPARAKSGGRYPGHAENTGFHFLTLCFLFLKYDFSDSSLCNSGP